MNKKKKPDHIDCQSGYIPAELQDYDQWVLWAYEKRNGTWTKVPYSPESLEKCDITNKQVLTDFTKAKKQLEKHNGSFAGLGFAVFADDPFVFVDLDHCRNPDTSELTLKARTILEKLDTYTEVSPSGAGIRAISKGKLPAGARKQGDVELYDEKKYLTVTGQTLPNFSAIIESRAAEIKDIHRRYLSKPAIQSGAGNQTDSKLSIEDLLTKARASEFWPKFNKLWEGDWSDYKETKKNPEGENQSGADLALCGYLVRLLGPYPKSIDKAFRESGLIRKKWDEKRGSTTWGAMTIDTALEGAETVTKKSSPQKPIYRRTGMTADVLSKKEFKEPRWAVPKLFPEGSVILAGKPKTGKSMAALNVAVGITSGNNLVFGKIVVEPGAVLYLALEDNFRRLQQRLITMTADGGVASPDLHLFTEWPHMGADGLEMLEEKIKSIPNLRLVIIDTLAKFKPPKPKNVTLYDFDYSVMSQITRVAQNNNVCMIVVHHMRKMESEDRFDDISGSFGVTGGADATALLLRTIGQADAELRINGRDLEPEEFALKFDSQYLAWNITGKMDEILSTDNKQKVFDAICGSTEAMTPKQVAEKTGIDKKYVQRLLVQLVKEGTGLKKVGHGKYKVPTIMEK